MNKQKKQQSTKKKNKTKNTARERSGEKKVSKKPKFGLSTLKSKIEHTVKAKKIIGFIKNSTKSIPHLLTKEQSKLLLPKLESIILSEQEDNEPDTAKIRFIQAEDNLRESMVQFKKNIEEENQDLETIELQTRKCYRRIPQLFFKPDLTPDELNKNLRLTKNHRQMQENVYQLMDYSDEVQFNINQQVGAKIRIFTNFVKCMDSLQQMVVVNTKKIKQARGHTSVLRDIIISRSIRINKNRLKQERLSSLLDFLNNLKKMKELQAKLCALIEIGNVISHDSKSKSGSQYREYCQIHNELVLQFCCKSGRGLCKYWDLAYFVERGFQQNFIKLLKNYIFEVLGINHDLQIFKRSHSINKKNFSTTPASVISSFSGSIILDESYEVDAIEQVELLVKQNVEKEIAGMFEQGMEKYSFSTDILAEELKAYLEKYLEDFLKEVLSEIDSEICLSLKELMLEEKDKDGKRLPFKFYKSDRCKTCLQKIAWSRFEKILQIISNRLQHLNIRIFSVINKILWKALPLENDFNERYQVIGTYMIQLILLVLSFSDDALTYLIRTRIKTGDRSFQVFKSKGESFKEFDLETENMKKVIKFCKKWETHISFLKISYPFCKNQIEENFTKSQVKIGGKQKWTPEMFILKGQLVRSAYENMHQSITDRELKQKLEEDSWQVIEISSNLYETLGYIMGGNEFLVEQEKRNKDLLSKSLLLEKNISEVDLPHCHKQSKYSKEEYSSKFRVNPMYITLGKFRFKITSSTEQMIKFLKHYLELFDDTSDSDVDRKYDLHVRITEIILKYNQYIRDLILKSEAIKLGRINAKAIGGKHLITAYSQLKIIDLIFCGEIMQDRIKISEEECNIMHEKLSRTKNEIKSRYMKSIQTRIFITIQELNYKEDSILSSEKLLSISKNIRSSMELFEAMMIEESQIDGFLDMSAAWVSELESKLNKAKSKERKAKVIGFMQSELANYLHFMPKVKNAISAIKI